MSKAAVPSSTPESRLYTLFGLNIRSVAALPCPLSPDQTALADVELTESTAEEIAHSCNGAPIYSGGDSYWQDALFPDGSARVSWKDHFEFAVSGDGRRVHWRRWPGVSEESLTTYLLGHTLSYCLLARGIESLHATCVEFQGKALALMGDSGYGKSTLAAGLLAQGCRLLTDDVLVLKFQGDQVLACPSLSRIKLLPESADALLDGRRSTPMNSFTPKMIFSLEPSQHASTPVPLQRVYLIPRDSGSRIMIRTVRGRAAFLPIVKNTFNNVVLTPERIKRQFAFVTDLTRRVPVKRLTYPKRLEVLPDVVRRILEDAHGGKSA